MGIREAVYYVGHRVTPLSVSQLTSPILDLLAEFPLPGKSKMVSIAADAATVTTIDLVDAEFASN